MVEDIAAAAFVTLFYVCTKVNYMIILQLLYMYHMSMLLWLFS